MRIIKVNVSRITLRNRGSASEIAIDGELIIQPDDPEADSIRQHMPENVRVDSLPAATQTLVANLFKVCQARLERQHPTSGR